MHEYKITRTDSEACVTATDGHVVAASYTLLAVRTLGGVWSLTAQSVDYATGAVDVYHLDCAQEGVYWTESGFRALVHAAAITNDDAAAQAVLR